MSDLDQQFDDAVAFVRTPGSGAKPSNDEKLKFYALFKQATDGDVSGKKPGLTDFVGRAKYSAWENLKGTSSESAKQKYIALVDSIRNK